MTYQISNERKTEVNRDSDRIINEQYNNASGSEKIIHGGVYLKSIVLTDATWTLDCSTARYIGKGRTVALYNNSAVVHAVCIGVSTIGAPTAGIVNATGQPGIAIPANSWVYINTYDQQYIRTDNALVYCYIVEDDTYLE